MPLFGTCGRVTSASCLRRIVRIGACGFLRLTSAPMASRQVGSPPESAHKDGTHNRHPQPSTTTVNPCIENPPTRTDCETTYSRQVQNPAARRQFEVPPSILHWKDRVPDRYATHCEHCEMHRQAETTTTSGTSLRPFGPDPSQTDC